MRWRNVALALIGAVSLLPVGCKTREPTPSTEGTAETDPWVTDRDRMLAEQKGPPPLVGQCNDVDADCDPGEYCNRNFCWTLDDRTREGKFLIPCKSEEDCFLPDGDKLLCLKGRCRGCMSAEECAPGGEKAGWYCRRPAYYCAKLPKPDSSNPPREPAAPSVSHP
jgi:hypothetical protein